MTHDEVIRAILAEPDNDEPRLILADWLEEQGDAPRAEFIRIQCETAALTKPSMRGGPMYGSGPFGRAKSYVRHQKDLPKYQQLITRQLELLNRHVVEWVAPMGTQVSGVVFDRGYPEGFATRADTYLRNAEEWYGVIPLRQLRVRDVNDLEAFLRSPYLVNLQTLDLSESGIRLATREATLLAECKNLVNLRRLDKPYGMQDIDGNAQILFDSLNLRNLKYAFGRERTIDESMQGEKHRGR